MTHANIRGRTPVARDPLHKRILITGDSMLGCHSLLDPPYNPPRVIHEIDSTTGLAYRCDGGPIVGRDQGGPGRLSVLPYWLDMALANGAAPGFELINLQQGGASSHDWCPVAPPNPNCGTVATAELCNQALAAIAAYQPHMIIHHVGRWDVNVGRDMASVRALTAWLYACYRSAGFTGRLVTGLNTFLAWDPNQAKRDQVRGGLWQAFCDDANAHPGKGSLGPDEDQYPVTEGSWRIDGVHYASQSRYYMETAWRNYFFGL